jgi:hypothetical protein
VQPPNTKLMSKIGRKQKTGNMRFIVLAPLQCVNTSITVVTAIALKGSYNGACGAVFR